MDKFIHLRKALVCSDCEVISQGCANCPACGSSALFGLWRFIPNCQSSASLKLKADAVHADVLELERIVNL